MKNNNLLFMAMTAISLPLSASTTEHDSNTESPNLLYIFPDQYRLFALSIWNDPAYKQVLTTVGDPVYTPNLDKLAKEGVLFTNVCSTQPVSSPHRAMLLSGMYPSKNGVKGNCYLGNSEELHHDIVCLTDVLAQEGYETAYVGKTHWHKTEALFDKDGNYKGTIENPGGVCVNRWDTYIPEGKSRHSNKFWFQQLKDSHFNAYAYSNHPELVGGKSDGESFRPKRFTAEVEADIVIDYIKNKGNVRDENRPFSMIWSINPPHPPYNKISDCDSTIFNKYYKNLDFEDLLIRENVFKPKNQKAFEKLKLNAKVYFSLVKSVDEEIGRVLKALEEKGLVDNTIVVFTSDHGEMMGSHGKMQKSVFYDESMLVPFIIKYPMKLKPKVENLMLGSADIMPTMLGLMGLENKIPKTVMGSDFSDGLLTGKYCKNPKPQSALYLNAKMKGVRTYKYTYVVKEDNTYELYDNIKDPYQKKKILLDDILPEDVTFLQKSLGMWLNKACDTWAEMKLNEDLIKY